METMRRVSGAVGRLAEISSGDGILVSPRTSAGSRRRPRWRGARRRAPAPGIDGGRLRDRWWNFPRPGESCTVFDAELFDRKRRRAGAGRCAAACDRSGGPNRRGNRPRRHRGRGEAVRDALAFVDDVHDRSAADRAGIVGLAAGGGIEGRAIEINRAAVRGSDRPRARGIRADRNRRSRAVRSSSAASPL